MPSPQPSGQLTGFESPSSQNEPHKQAATGHASSKKQRKNGGTKESSGQPVTSLPDEKLSAGEKPYSIPDLTDITSPRTVPKDVGSNAVNTPSPLLQPASADALHTFQLQNTSAWGKAVPMLSGSPGNLISLGESPPNFPSSYTDERGYLTGRQNLDRHSSSARFASTSPPVPQRRPMSFHVEAQQRHDDSTHPKQASPYRRSSMYSSPSHRYQTNPPPPHLSQAHFYGLPEPIFAVPTPSSGLKAGSRDLYLGFDALHAVRDTISEGVVNVVISGYEGGMDIYAINKRGFDKIYCLDELRGGVYSAKILPWTSDASSNEDGPFVALVLHGPVLSDLNDATSAGWGEANLISGEEPFHTKQRIAPAQKTIPAKDLSYVEYYQTSVEVYSLKTKRHVTTLLTLPKMSLNLPLNNPLCIPPSPQGLLQITAADEHIVLSSGISGETWIFYRSAMEFKCAGKIWTSTHDSPALHPLSPQGSEHNGEDNHGSSKPSQTPKAPLLALSGRWLAYNPPTTTVQMSLGATVGASISTMKATGINSHASPPPPGVNCASESTEQGSLLHNVLRTGTQEVIKGASWLGYHGKQAWQSYWSKSSDHLTTAPGGFGQYWPGIGYAHNDGNGLFPPTHGESLVQGTTSTASDLVSILDIAKFGHSRSTTSNFSQPLATFKVPLGCSFISFAPNGLALFTASTKGDVQFVWDLMRIQHTRSSLLQMRSNLTSSGNHVRQLAVFTRMTVARVVDIIWTVPYSDRIALVTERNTIHLLELPARALAWPPPRRPVSQSQDIGGSTPIDVTKAATALASNAVGAIWTAAQPLVNRSKETSHVNGVPRPMLSTMSMTAHAGHSSKALASGISKSLGVATGTLESFRTAGEKRLHLSHGSSLIRPGCLMWFGSSGKEVLGVLSDGMVKFYSIRRKTSQTASGKSRLKISATSKELVLPNIPEDVIAPVVARAIGLQDELDLSERDPEAPSWALAGPPSPYHGTVAILESSIPQAEIESNAPFQPFHTDRRVNFYTYAPTDMTQAARSASVLLDSHDDTTRSAASAPNLPDPPDEVWVFGEPLSVCKLHAGSWHTEDHDGVNAHFPLPSSAMERITTILPDNDETAEQIVVTTRRRKGPPEDRTDRLDEDGFFEDDCEVLDFASQRV